MFDLRIYEFIITVFASLGALSDDTIKRFCFIIVGVLGIVVLLNLIKHEDDHDKKLK